MWAVETTLVSKFFDHGDVRLPQVFPRIAERYAIPGLPAVWYAPSRRKKLTGKAAAIDVRIVEISTAGFMVEAPSNKRIEIGSRIKMNFHGVEAIIEVCNMREEGHPEKGGTSVYGVSFYRVTSEFEVLVASIVHKLQLANKQ